MSQLSFGKKRLIIAVALLPAVGFLANEYFKWFWLDGYGEIVTGIAFIPLMLAFGLLKPTEEEIRAYRAERDREKASKE